MKILIESKGERLQLEVDGSFEDLTTALASLLIKDGKFRALIMTAALVADAENKRNDFLNNINQN